MSRKQAEKLLVVNNLTIRIQRMNEMIDVVHNVNFEIDYGKTLALVGESGSGKTLTALSIMGLLPKQVILKHGEIHFKGQRLTGDGNCSYNYLRGKHIAILFQNAISALNPVFKIGQQLKDVMKAHHQWSTKMIKQEILRLFTQVGLSQPERVCQSYPHQLSGGMAQRVMIAMALSCKPELIIADEPTTALDIKTQLKILDLISRLQKQYQFSMLLISHDLNVVSSVADDMMVMQQGRIVETNTVSSIFNSPQHPYTKALINL